MHLYDNRIDETDKDAVSQSVPDWKRGIISNLSPSSQRHWGNGLLYMVWEGQTAYPWNHWQTWLCSVIRCSSLCELVFFIFRRNYSCVIYSVFMFEMIISLPPILSRWLKICRCAYGGLLLYRFSWESMQCPPGQRTCEHESTRKEHKEKQRTV